MENIDINNFRNLTRQVLRFNKNMNVIHGLNAQGKTNLLEAIYYLAVSRSFRTYMESEIPNYRKDDGYFSLKGVLVGKNRQKTIEISYFQNKTLKINVNGVPIRRAEYIHHNPIVVFGPDDLLLIKEGPSTRRRFLNMEGARLEPLYYQTLKDYNRVLQQRNSILKEKKGSSLYHTIQPWNESLIRLGTELILKRICILKAIEKQAGSFFQELTSSEEVLSLHYCSSVSIDGQAGQIKCAFEERLKETARQELIRGSTLVGPHLDDFNVSINEYDAKKYASQGQQRTAVLAIKMGEVNLFRYSAGESPMILLDDIFSEFDSKRREKLLHFLITRDGQSFITAATTGNLLDVMGHYKIFSVYKGNIKDEQTGADC